MSAPSTTSTRSRQALLGTGILTRRTLLTGAALGAGGLLAGCDALAENEGFRKILFLGEEMNKHSQRLLVNRNALAPEFSPSQRSPFFRGNGSQNPQNDGYPAHAASNFANWRLAVDGLVQRPLNLSMAQIRSMPARTQTTRHDCVEGWSAIGTWTGVPLRTLLDQAGLRDSAKYIVFHCADDSGGGNLYYESVDMIDAFHPQTILAWGLNGQMLPVINGAPLRLRVERHLGYKHAKYVRRIEARSTLAGVGLGKGGFWEDRAMYEWYAGV